MRRELPALREILDRLPVRLNVDPKTVKAEGSVGVSPEEAEALLASVGVVRSPLVKVFREQ